MPEVPNGSVRSDPPTGSGAIGQEVTRMMRTRTTWKIGVLAVALAVSLGACQTAPRTGSAGGSFNDPYSQQLADRNSRFNATVAEGAIIGTLLGAAAGAAIGGDWESAAIGAGAGLATGAVAGYFVASNNQNYATREQALNGQIQQARAQVAEYQRDVNVTRQLVSAKRQRIQSLQGQLASGEITAGQYRAQISDVQGSVRVIQENIAANEQNMGLIEQEIAQFRREGYNTSGLEAELRRYRSLRDQQVALLRELTAAQAAG